MSAPYTGTELARVRRDKAAGVPVKVTAHALGRTEGSVCNQRHHLGLQRSKHSRDTYERVLAMAADGMSARGIGRALGISPSAGVHLVRRARAKAGQGVGA